MQENRWKNIGNALSGDRLSAYSQDGVSREVLLARYLWNMAVCESLYAPLQMCEVGLRNTVHHAMSHTSGSLEWYCSPHLTDWAKEQVAGAQAFLGRQRKPTNPGRVVAELNFGFWTALFEPHYENPRVGFLPRGIKLVFPHMPKSEHSHKAIKRRLDRIRRLRNRVFHHERVIHWKDLSEQHADLRSLIRSMSTELHSLTDLVDSFEAVHSGGVQPYLDKIRANGYSGV